MLPEVEFDKMSTEFLMSTKQEIRNNSETLQKLVNVLTSKWYEDFKMKAHARDMILHSLYVVQPSFGPIYVYPMFDWKMGQMLTNGDGTKPAQLSREAEEVTKSMGFSQESVSWQCDYDRSIEEIARDLEEDDEQVVIVRQLYGSSENL